MKVWRGFSSVGISALAVASAASAQGPTNASDDRVAQAVQASGESAMAGEIIVTAQKRSESVQKIPLAVTAISGAALQQRATNGLAALGQIVPGLNVSEQVGQARLTLRGIGVDNISTGAESSVAFNQDGVFYSRSAAALASFYDVDRVEVLRGPQGTLYGRNATGGSVNIITNRPTDTLHGGISLTGGNYKTIDGEGFLSGPLSDTVSGRLSFQAQHRDGYGENIVTGTDIDTKNSQAVRGQLLIKPDDRLTVLLASDYYRSHDRSNIYHYFGPGGVSPTGATVVPTGLLLGGHAAPNERDIATAQDPSAHAEFYGARADIGYRLSDSVTLRSLSAYRHSDFTVRTEPSPFSVSIFPLTVTERSNQITQEFQINVERERNKFVGGVFYLHEKINGLISAPFNIAAISPPGTPNFFVQGFYLGGTLKTDAAAAYAQDTYSLTSSIRLTVGGRFSWERKTVADRAEVDFARPYSPANGPLTAPHLDHKVFRSFTPKVGIDIDVAPRTLVYASFSKGFKAGTYNLGGAGPPLRPEKVDAYEAGIKATSSNGQLRANVAGFYYEYADLQVGKVQGPLLVLENAATARIYGLEGEFTAKPTPELTLGVNASWLQARFRKYVTADQARPAGDGLTVDEFGAPAFNLHGNTLPQSPNYTVGLSVDYVVPLARGSLTFRGESNWSGRVYFTPFNRPELSQSAYSLQNAFVTYDYDSHWRLTAFVRNISNKTIRASGQVSSSLFGSPITGFLQPPRTYGATVSYRF